MNLHKTTHDMPHAFEHSPPTSTLLHPPSSPCTNRSGITTTQPKPKKNSTTHRPQPHTLSPLRSMAIQTETVTTSKHKTHNTRPPVCISLLTTRTCYNYSYIADKTEYIGHRTLAADPTLRGTGVPLATTKSSRRHGPHLQPKPA